MISVKGDVDEVVKYLTALERRQVPFAARNAINNTLFGAQKEVRSEMQRTFDRPTNYTIHSTRVQKADYKPGKWYLKGQVWIKDRLDAGKGTTPANFLLPNIVGGARNIKRFERSLQLAKVLPKGWKAVTGEGADVDSYGNISKGQIVQILSYFRAFQESGFRANMTEKGRARLARGTKKKRGRSYFVARPGDARTRHLQPGIYSKTYTAWGAAIKPVLIFVQAPRYQRNRFDFFGVQERYVRRHFPAQFAIELQRAIDTAAAKGKL